jgi:chemotaxis protein MotB
MWSNRGAGSYLKTFFSRHFKQFKPMSIRKANSKFVQSESDPNAWMTTFGDLIMLLLTFFVLLLTMKSMDDQIIKSMFDDLAESTGPLEYERSFGEGSSLQGQGLRPQAEAVVNQEAVEKILALMESMEDREPGQLPVKQLERLLDVGEDERGVVLSLEADHLFLPGRASVQPFRLMLLDRINELLKHSSNDILIMGHTDDLPLRRGQGPFASNWELSFYRALSIFYYMTDSLEMSPKRVAVGGYGATRPLVPNVNSADRAKNRRVEFILRRPVM